MDDNKVIEHYCSARGMVVNSVLCRNNCEVPRDQCKLQKLSDTEELISIKLSKTKALLIIGALECSKCSMCEIRHPTKCNECSIGQAKSALLGAMYGPRG
jgi:hypothetical protein